jgi:ATP/maltotriose-dependent transcriptional regulator MalT
VLRIAALALLRGTLTGDPAHDRGNYTFLAELQAETGDLDGAVALLDQAARTFPGEFTFPYAAARQLLDATRFADAEPRARTALARAWGDQELRAAVVLAKVLDGEARRPEAIAVLDAALKETPRPDEAVKVRTHRYVKEAESLRAQLVAPSATKPTGAPAAR